MLSPIPNWKVFWLTVHNNRQFLLRAQISPNCYSETEAAV